MDEYLTSDIDYIIQAPDVEGIEYDKAGCLISVTIRTRVLEELFADNLQTFVLYKNKKISSHDIVESGLLEKVYTGHLLDELSKRKALHLDNLVEEGDKQKISINNLDDIQKVELLFESYNKHNYLQLSSMLSK